MYSIALSNEELDLLAKALNESTSGLWDIAETVGVGWAVKEYDEHNEQPGHIATNLSQNDALFIAMAKNFLPALLKEVRETRKMNNILANSGKSWPSYSP